MGMVPQHKRHPQTIMDYTFSGENQEAARGAPPEAMQFGKALDHILQRILATTPQHGPTYMLKLDLSDGFYRVRLRAEDIPTLGVAFPCGSWGGTTRRLTAHTAHGLDGESTLLLQRHQNLGGPHQSTCLPLLGSTTASSETRRRYTAPTGW